MVSYRSLVAALRDLGLGARSRLMVHCSMTAFGEVVGGADTVVGALLGTCEAIVMPTFTYQTMVTPSIGPPANALDYGVSSGQNNMVEFFRPSMPADRSMGVVSEALRKNARSTRSAHPILSFSGVSAEEALEAQSLEDPLATIGALASEDGDVLLLGTDHTANISLHYAEKHAGRKQFVRWALTTRGVVECPGYPGCSDGFLAISTRLGGVARYAQLGELRIESVPLRDLIHIAVGWIRQDPEALLCERADCARCNAVRDSISVSR